MKEEIMKCQFCGGEEFVVAEQSGFANIHVKKGFSFKETPIMHQVCKSCGAIVKSYVKDIEKICDKKAAEEG